MFNPMDLLNGFLGWGMNAWNISDKSHWNKEQWAQYINEWRWKQQQDLIAQENYRENMQLAKDQFAFQQDQFQANRIGNLTKEYAEAGLNPYLAAGMGASTAGVVGGGGTANMASNPSKPGIDTSQTMMNQMKMENAMQMASLKMQKQMNDAQIGNINAQTELTKAQEESERLRPALIEAQTNQMIKNAKLTEEQIESMNYQQVEQKIIAEFLAENPDLKKEQIAEELKAQGIENKLKKAQTAREKAEIVYGAIRTLIYGFATGASIATRGAFSAPVHVMGFHM